jgi:hypothetical protein
LRWVVAVQSKEFGAIIELGEDFIAQVFVEVDAVEVIIGRL